MQFPSVPADADEAAVNRLADSIVQQVWSMHPAAVLCQGEFTLSYRVIAGLKALGIPVLAACSARRSEEIRHPDGTSEKRVIFRFERFREY